MAPDDDNTHAVTVLSKGTSVGHYRIVEKIGAGGMGEVYLAEDTSLNRQVALKFLSSHLCQDADCRARFKREAQAAANLDHPNIVTVYEVGEFQGRPFFAMQHIEGQSLKEYSSLHELTIPRVLEIGIQIAEGLQAAHEKGVTHRDIKPANVLIDSHGRARILDFGLASVVGTDHLTKTGSTLGTIGYMSPEQVRGEQVDHRSDIFSFGVVLYELITGRQPFKGDNDTATSRNIIDREPEPLARYKSGVGDELQRVISKTLEKDRALRYQHADELAADVKGISSKLQTALPARDIAAGRRRPRFAIPAILFGIIFAAFLIFKPWKFVIEPTHQAMAGENRLAIMYFDNLADPADSSRLGEIATNLLITNLSESQYLQVVSSQRLYDILKLIGKEGVKRVDRSVAALVADKARAKQMLLGSVLQISPEIILTSQIIDVVSGNVVASQKITGTTGEQIFPIIDRLSVEVKKDLSLPQAALSESAPQTADLTTHSAKAYQYYLEGVDYVNKFYWTDAENSFKSALAFDSTFAMAYQWLALINIGTQMGRKYISKAVEYSEKVSQKEKLYIRMQEANISGNPEQAIKELLKIVERYPDEKDAFGWLGAISYQDLRKTDDAIRYLSKAIELDSLNKLAYNQLAGVYSNIGDYEKSLWAINKYISIAPNEANPYDTRGDIYAENGKIDQAIESYRKALEIKPDFLVFSTTKLGNMYLLKRDYAGADNCYRQLTTDQDKTMRSQGRSYLANIPAYQGKFDHALQVLDDGLAADRIEQAEGRWSAHKHLSKALIYEEKNDLNLALREMEAYIEIYGRIDPEEKVAGRLPYARLLALNKEFAKASQVAEAVKSAIDTSRILLYWWVLGCIELAKGNLETSLAEFQKAAYAVPDFAQHYMHASAYLEAGKLGESVTEFEKVLSRYDSERATLPIWAVKAHYLLGLAYEKSGWTKKAIEKYEEFLNIWKDADPGLKDVEDAKSRLARLKAKS